MSKEIVAAAGVAGVAGGVFAIAIRNYLKTHIPADMVEQIQRLSFYDTVFQQSMTNCVVLEKWKEGDWDTYLLGISTPEYAPNDIIVEIGKNRVTDEVNATIAKLSWNRVDVYVDKTFLLNLPQYAGFGIQTAVYILNLRKAR